MLTRRHAAHPVILVVIGAHRDELAFGDKVAGLLDEQRFSILRIQQGICGIRPRPDERAAFLRRHHDLYMQILDHVAPHHQVLIDLHCGIDQTGKHADLFSADPKVLACLTHATAAAASDIPDASIRGVRLVADTTVTADPTPDGWPVARAEIPEPIWNRPIPRYVGVEVYLTADGAGSDGEQHFAATVLAGIADCLVSEHDGARRDRNRA